MGKFLRGLRNKIRRSLEKEVKGTDGFSDKIMETHSERANRTARKGKSSGIVIPDLIKIPFGKMSNFWRRKK